MSRSQILETSDVTLLNALTAVSLDTEATGLDVSRDRLVQIGAIRINRGTLEQSLTYQTLVNPGIPIPAAATKIHGISDKKVKDARKFSDIKPELEAWVGDAIVVGHSIGFDLAILKSECILSHLNWKAPRTIDVQHIVNILAPELPDYSLDTLANWLQVPVINRHDALADAGITAKVFLALIPKLINHGIRTLAELETSCRVFNRNSLIEAQSGWYDFLNSPDRKDSAKRVYARIDSYPYQHRVRDIMSAPTMKSTGDKPVSFILETLMQRKISSIFVEPAGSENSFGIVTERDILRAINNDGSKALSMPVSSLASYPVLSINHDAFLYRAMGMMTRHGLRHLGVTGSDSSLVGVITSRDLLKQKTDDALNLGDAINHAAGEQDLAAIWANIALIAIALDQEDVDVRDIAAVISRELQALTRRCCELAEQEMIENGMGEAPVPYAMLVLGSGGRGESLLAMDQDNAIVYLEGNCGSIEDQWFEQLGSRVSNLLHHSGVPYCKGHIMASNSQWRMSVTDWKSQIKTWVSRTSPEDILKTDIFFDAVSVHGDFTLMAEISDFALQLGSSSREFLHLLSTNAANTKSPMGIFGRFKLQNDGRIDIKMGGILPIFSAARVLAIRYGIQEKSTPGRLYAVKDAGHLASVIENLVEAHEIIMTAILKQQLYDLKNGIPLSNTVAPGKMKPALRNNLRWALQQVPSVSDLLEVPLY